MTIPEIKSRLSILSVLAHYGLQPGSGNSLKCPFHDDAKASMKVYAETGTVYCFAGGCSVESLDVIDFIMHQEGSTKRAAILKAKSLCGEKQVMALDETTAAATPTLNVVKIYDDSYTDFDRTPSGREYCRRRGLDQEVLQIGYRSRKAAERWGRGCIIFALLGRDHQTVSLYGRAVKGSGHYYTPGRRGLYPQWPNAESTQLVLAESVIDAATLIGRELEVLALYGTNGLTEDHRVAIQAMHDLTEIVLTLDGDAAGRKATVELARELRALSPGVKVTSWRLPEGEDVNSLMTGDEVTAGTLDELMKNRFVVGDQINVPTVAVKPTEPQIASPAHTSLTAHTHYLEYVGVAATYRIRGGVRGGAESLKVSLQIRRDNQDYRTKVDLYEYKQAQGLAERAADVLTLRKDQVLTDLDQLTKALENYRETTAERPRSRKPEYNIGAGERAAVLAFLRRPDLLEQLGDYLGRAGIVGEHESRLLIYLVALSHQTKEPLHVLVQGSSGSGKTHLITNLAELLPPEDVIMLTRVTDSSFYNYGSEDLKHKLIVLEDLDGLKEEALLAFRELQSRGRLTSSTSVKDQSGNIKGVVRTVYGPVASLAATTRGEIYEDNLSRCLIVAVDESDTQTKAVIEYQNKKAAGLIDTVEEMQLRGFLRSCARLLDRGKEVINPYATQIQLPAEASKLRRLNALYQSFVRQMVLLHQYQREVDVRGRLIAEPADLQSACDILFDSIVLKVDELDGALRYFYERLKDYVLTRGREYEFTRREVRQSLRISKTQQHAYLTQLLELEYIRQVGGYANRGLTYKIAYWDNAEAVREKLKTHLNEQLEAIRDFKVAVV